MLPGLLKIKELIIQIWIYQLSLMKWNNLVHCTLNNHSNTLTISLLDETEDEEEV